MNRICISYPRRMISDNGIAHLKKILENRGSTIKKALGVTTVHIEITEEQVQFPWFTDETTPDELQAYSRFICALCKMANDQKRINKPSVDAQENEKYAFRCFLLRLGFIGDKYKEVRKILMRRLKGSSAWKTAPAKNADSTAEQTGAE